MTDHRFSVERPDRTVCFSITSEEADAARKWLKEMRSLAKAAIGGLAEEPPMILNELYGAFDAIAENRPYGGH